MTPCRHCGARWRLHDEWLCPKRPAGELRAPMDGLPRGVAWQRLRGAARMTPAEIDAEVARFRAELAKTPDAEEPQR
jgi:hypothetical protein